MLRLVIFNISFYTIITFIQLSIILSHFDCNTFLVHQYQVQQQHSLQAFLNLNESTTTLWSKVQWDEFRWWDESNGRDDKIENVRRKTIRSFKEERKQLMYDFWILIWFYSSSQLIHVCKIWLKILSSSWSRSCLCLIYFNTFSSQMLT